MTLAPDSVRTMFDRIAPVYDVMNHVMTAGLDVRWRRLAAESVVRPGGRVAILEITQPRGALRPFYSLWFNRVVPLLGKALPGGDAYTYLPASVKRFPTAERLADVLRETGFDDVRFRLLAGSIVALHTGQAA